nr:hypothetical protein [uncultured Cupriavidus sp.]
MHQKKLKLRHAVTVSATLVSLLLSGHASAELFYPEECPGEIEAWTAKDYPADSCVHLRNRVYTNMDPATAGEQPRKSDAWWSIGDYIGPGGLTVVDVTVPANGEAKPAVHTVKPAQRDTRLQFAVTRPNESRRKVLFDGPGYNKLHMWAKSDLKPGNLFPVWLRLQRTTSGEGLSGARGPVDAIGGDAGLGTFIAWYDPADNPDLVPGARYTAAAGLWAKVQIIGTDLPKQPELGTFRLGLDIVHQRPTQPAQ